MSKIGEAMAKAGDPSTSSGQATTPEEQPAEVRDAEFKEGDKGTGEQAK